MTTNATKLQMFAAVTYIISYVCFKFNTISHLIVSMICEYLDDECVPTYGPYMYRKPVNVRSAFVDGRKCTNKVELLLNWYWDADINGIMTTDILVQGSKVVMTYDVNPLLTTREYTTPDTRRCMLDRGNNMFYKLDSHNRSSGRSVLFNELDLLK
jgi:hypothetical protein